METPREQTLKRYLFGELSEHEMAEFEARCFEDDELFHEMTELEHDLLHSYVRGELSPAEHRQFEKGYLISPARRRKLQLAQELEESLFTKGPKIVSSRGDQYPVKAHPRLQILSARFLGAIAALFSIAAIAWLLLVNYRLRNELGRMGAEQAQLREAQRLLETKLAALTTQIRESTAARDGQNNSSTRDLMAFNLAPGLPRSGGGVKQLPLSPDVQRIMLNLYLEDDKYSGYAVALVDSGGKELLRKAGLTSHVDAQGHPIISFEILNVPASGDYVIKLDGIRGNTIDPGIAAYYFRLARH